ncbi:hypothetical protein N657DRAFT_328988 [Parathielavia appendiculata]|uniref:Uncharacterized protein n=1 Tax=Parathielavia appendiculata TaxID=2587402 RepID=A0AAN6TQ90_9PEZI|nr:hypothetical protein N657DRAFT_328988 [Parathielavia appendiculata]
MKPIKVAAKSNNSCSFQLRRWLVPHLAVQCPIARMTSRILTIGRLSTPKVDLAFDNLRTWAPKCAHPNQNWSHIFSSTFFPFSPVLQYLRAMHSSTSTLRLQFPTLVDYHQYTIHYQSGRVDSIARLVVPHCSSHPATSSTVLSSRLVMVDFQVTR